MSRGSSPKGTDSAGYTFVELMVVMVLTSLLGLFLFHIIRSFHTGVTSFQRAVPLQQSLQVAKAVIEKDLLSSPRSSIGGNVVPNPGFEMGSDGVSPTTPPPPGSWACVPIPLRLLPAAGFVFSYGDGDITSRPNFFYNGNLGLTVNTAYTSFAAQSSTFSLVDGVTYLFGGRIKQHLANGQNGELRILGDPLATPWPMTIATTLVSNATVFSFVATTLTGNAAFRYRIEAGFYNPAIAANVVSFDDILLVPVSFELTPTNGRVLEFQSFREGPSLSTTTVTMRYRIVPEKASGRLIRERLNMGGTVTTLMSLDNVRRLSVGWDFGEGLPGVFPAVWPAGLFANGLNHPLIVTIESGDVGAVHPKTLSMTFSVYPVAP